MKPQRSNPSKPVIEQRQTSAQRPAPQLHLVEHLSVRTILAIFGAIEVLLILILIIFGRGKIDRIMADNRMIAKDWAGAEKYLVKLQKKNPDAFFENYQLGTALDEVGKAKEAIPYLEKVRDQANNPEYAQYKQFYFGVLAKSYLDAGQIKEAEGAVRDALMADYESPLANLVMGQIYLKKNNMVQAANHMRYLVKDPDYKKELDSFNEQARKMLEVPAAELSDVPERVAASPVAPTPSAVRPAGGNR